MKRYNNLWDKICTIDNFKLAYKNAIRHKKHYKEVQDIEKNNKRDEYIQSLYEEVKDGKYTVSEYEIYDKNCNGKIRTIFKLPLKDRIVQHALMNIIEPIFRESFICDTYQSIKGRGSHKAVAKIKKAAKQYKYCLEFDIHKCYPSISQELLKEKLKRKFKDKKLLSFLYMIIDSCDSGVPIGNYTSQYFNNFYFSNFDHWVKEVKRIKCYYRYCDNGWIFGNSKEELHRLLKEISDYMIKERVHLNNSCQVFPIDKRYIDSLGYKINNKRIKIKKKTKSKFKWLTQTIDFTNITPRQANQLGSYWGLLVKADCRNLWFIYTGVKSFNDLNIKVHERNIIKNIIGIPLIIKNASIYHKKKQEYVRITADYTDIYGEHNNVYISTSAEMIIEALKQVHKNDFPFSTVVEVTNNKYYKFK